MDTPSTPRFDSALARRYLDDWERLCRRPATRRAIAAWGLVGADGSHVDRPDAVLDMTGFFGRLDDDAADAALLHVVRIAASDLLAARVTLQRILPALVAVAKRRGTASWSARVRAFDEVVAAAWIVIRTYPVERRPRRVASNLVRDAEYHAFVRTRRLRSAGEQVGRRPVGVDDVDTPSVDGCWGAPEPLEEVCDVLDIGRASGVAVDDLRFAAGIASGRSVGELALAFGICERSVRNRRARVAAALRAAAHAAEVA